MSVENMRREVPIPSITLDFYVRDASSIRDIEATIEQYVVLMQHGTQFPPIQLTPGLRLVAGRLRLEAAKRSGAETVLAEILPQMTDVQYLAIAIQENAARGLQPSLKDIATGIALMVKHGASDEDVIHHLKGSYTVSFIKERLQWYHSNQRQVLSEKVRLRVAEGTPPADVAKELGISLEHVKEIVIRKKGKNPKQAISKRIAGMNMSYGSSMSNILKTVNEAFDDGRIVEADVFSMLSQIAGQSAKTDKQLATFRSRFEQKIKISR